MSIIEKALKTDVSTEPASAKRRGGVDKRDALQKGQDYLETPLSEAMNRDLAGRGAEESPHSNDAEIASAGDGVPVLSAELRGSTNAGVPSVDLELDFADLSEKGFLTPMTPRSRLADEFRTIKRPLLKNIADMRGNATDYPNLVMVTSALQGDGKTFSSINLAISMAMEQDKTVLFVDADVLKATAGRTLGVPKDALGLIDLLQDDSDLEPQDVILRTNVEKLRILPAGRASDKSTELLASDMMHSFMIELSCRYPDRVIVFDSPPLLLTTEAAVLASFMGQIVFVASADVTPQHAVQAALEQISEDKRVGVVLNRASRRRSKFLGIGSYGYGYGYDHAYGAERATQRI